ncbi:AVAST type 3 anti-phage nuclease/ATPase Avs3a [Yersinia canariae]|uniref:AVAST type 3 anti-phage nuclease/ATPase Avs3a n=1 Tax=Yersinia canariae TaxID=2607663 RepID=UPI0011A42225|nr:AVAST type 3 anti-phage nuclease/ATPase Avs3a [Yersinia canariae]
MSDSLLVRASRDGDQFHYLWAARRALRLLDPKASITALTIEGASTMEMGSQPSVEEGEEIIDIAEYYGSNEFELATTVRYMQLKHSTLHAETAWPPSGLQKTIEGFAKRYKELLQRFPAESLHTKLELWFVTNRPVSTSFSEAITDAANQRPPRHPDDLAKLKKFTGLEDQGLVSFCQMLRIEERQDGYWEQRNILLRESNGYLPDLDTQAPLNLKELITRKALSESASDPAITRMDVLRALGVDETDLFPAPCLIEKIENVIPRIQEVSLVKNIVESMGSPIIVHADAGVGKSIFSTRIHQHLPEGSVSILYDCFGNGQYRNASAYRHHHRTALVQIANEIASHGLCYPLIPNASTDISHYMRAFMHRISQGISTLRASHPDAILCIIVDAADNAQMAAEEINESRSFIRDLLRETIPTGVCIVALCRPHRQSLLDPRPGTPSLTLQPFDRSETAAHLRGIFPDANDQDVDEFHRLSSHNPRVQALSLSRRLSLPETLRLLGPNPKTVEDTIGEVLEAAIGQLKDATGHTERTQIDFICAALAVLRPLIPIAILSAIAEIDESAIKSFALDLGRPLIVNGDTIQFFDEPAETWFQERYRPKEKELRQFIARLTPLTKNSAYAASVLPPLMLEAGQFSELVTLAMTSQGLPETSPIERRDVEFQRLQFALKAALRLEKYQDAAKLALKAGGESAGDSRQRKLLQDNLDLTAKFMDSHSVQELISRRAFSDTGWVGSQNVYNSALLSEFPELSGDARSRLRIALEWLDNWSSLNDDERSRENVTAKDRAVMAIAYLNIHGADEAARSLRRWRPRELSFDAGIIIAKQLLDHGRDTDLNQLAIAAGNDLGLILAIVLIARKYHYQLPEQSIKRGYCLLASSHLKIKIRYSFDNQTIAAITSMIEMALKINICNAEEAITILNRYLPQSPPNALSSEYSKERVQYIRMYALRAALSNSPLSLNDIASDKVIEEINAEKKHSESQELRELKQYSGVLIPWCNLWAKALIGEVSKTDLDNKLADAKKLSAGIKGYSYSEHSSSSDEIANIWFDILSEVGDISCADIEKITEWYQHKGNRVFTPTLHRFSRLCSQITGLEKFSFIFAQRALSLWEDNHTDAQTKAENYIDISRSLILLDKSESQEYFNQAIEVANKLGDENLERWGALLDLAEYIADKNIASPEIAYKFSRCAEVTREYVDRDKHFAWNDTIKVLSELCPSSTLAIISRWRDRTFGDHRNILALTIEQLVNKNKINPLDATALIPFREEWDEDKLLITALPLCKNEQDKQALFQWVYNYIQFCSPRSEKLARIKTIALSIGMAPTELNIYDPDETQTESDSKPASDHSTEIDEKSKAAWDRVFSMCDLSTSHGISIAYQNFSCEPDLYSTTLFIQEAITRINFGKEKDFIVAFGNLPEISLYSFTAFLESIPMEWTSRLSIKTAIASVAKSYCQRFCMLIRKYRYYEVFPFKLVSELSGLNEKELISIVLNATSESPEPSDSRQLFSLVGLLVNRLTSEEALNVLSYGLDLFNEVLKEEDGDGPWGPTLIPPTQIEDSLAGYIWARLASPESTVRWEAAHAVLMLCRLERSEVLQGIFQHAENCSTQPFCDRNLPFYTLHAQLWLLIAVARAAQDDGKALIPYTDYFYRYATSEQPHVLIRLFASRTLIALSEARLISITNQERDILCNINQSTYDSTASRSESLMGEDSYTFGIDFGPYWLEPLGRCFGVSQKQLEPEMLRIIRNDFGFKGSRNWEEDERNKRRYYQDSDNHHSHGSYPRVDDYHFYLSYHAMFMCAGKLLATKPLVDSRYDEVEDVFQDWLKRHDISRRDGRWLADRRDPQPDIRPSWIDDNSGNLNEWLGSISENIFDKALSPAAGLLTVWGHWSENRTDRRESVSVYTALVSPERSFSLLRALQTAENVYDNKIPSAGEDMEIDHISYQLKGWIKDISEYKGIDEHDPWAGDVTFPLPKPAPFIVEAMKLTTDKDQRVWHTTHSTEPEMISSIWGNLAEKNEDEKPCGHKLCASVDFIRNVLTTLNMDLIIEVDVNRYSRSDRYGRSNENELENIPSSTRIFLIKHDGTFRTLCGNYKAGEKAG